ncbi:MAG: AbgT family transporter [Chloroflexi bacterium]|nr:AbgT family transporter [Chloroflexota bacterium]
MAERAGAQISKKAFIQSIVILAVLMLLAGVLTLVVPAGRYARVMQGNREIIDPQSYQQVAHPDYPVWRWLVAPIEVIGSPDGVTIVTIIVFLLMVGSAFAVLDKSGILREGLGRIVHRFGHRRYLLLVVISFFFMAMGAFFGIFEEVVPLVPLMIALAYVLGWDSLVGLGMSILATNMGFSAAVTNPFTIGVAQQLAGLPLFSGVELRTPIFLAMYVLLAIFLLRYARAVDRDPQTSPVFALDQVERVRFSDTAQAFETGKASLGAAVAWFGVSVVLILLVLVAAPFVPAVAGFSLPLVGVLFLIGGIGAGLLSGAGGRTVLRAARDGVTGIAPSVPLILMAVSVKYIVVQGGIMDTLLHGTSQAFAQASPFTATLMMYVLALLIEFFIGSGSAKAFLLMPIVLPLADLVGVTRQVTVTAYCFGDGFSNLVYPTNPVLLISLGLTVVSYPKWLKWSLKLWFWVVLVTVAFLALAVAIRFGPF